jgi:hypothetical protein
MLNVLLTDLDMDKENTSLFTCVRSVVDECREACPALILQCIHRYAVLNPNEAQFSELIYSAVMYNRLVTEILMR